MNETKTVSARQLTVIIAVAVISAGARVLPGKAAGAGRAGSLIALAALPAGLVIVWMIGVLYKKYPNKGMADIFRLSLGGFFGNLALLVIGAAVPLVIAVFTARTHSELFISTIYPEASNYFFVIIAAAVTLFVTRRGLDRAARLSTVFAAVLFAALATVFFVSLNSISVNNLMPVYPGDFGKFFKTVPYGFIVPALIITGNLLSGGVHNRRSLCREGVWASFALCAALTLIITVCAGVLGTGLTARSVSPIFSAAKALSIPGIFERVDAFTVIVWILADITQMILAGFVFAEISGKLTNAKQSGFFASPFAFLTLSFALALSDGSLGIISAEEVLLGGGYAAATMGIFVIVFLTGAVKKF